MKQFKLSFVLSMLLSMVGLQAFADWDTSTKVEVNGLFYYLDKTNLTGQVTFMPFGNYSDDIVIPIDFLFEGNIYVVTSIGVETFYYCSGLTSITIPNSVTSIGDCAFCGCI